MEIPGEKMNICKRLGGIEENGICNVGGFPTYIDTKNCWGEWGTAEKLETGKAIIIQASPEDAKRLFPPNVATRTDTGVEEEYYYEDVIKNLMDRIKNKQMINPPFLIGCFNQKEPNSAPQTFLLGHEGRHRIEAARRAKIERVPIVLFEPSNCYAYHIKRRERNSE